MAGRKFQLQKLLRLFMVLYLSELGLCFQQQRIHPNTRRLYSRKTDVEGQPMVTEERKQEKTRIPSNFFMKKVVDMSPLLERDDTADDQSKKKEKFTMLALCWSVTFLSALDRVAMSVALVPIGEEFGYTDTMKGSVSSLFSVGYGIGIIPAGILVASSSPRLVMACGVIIWSLATIATPLAASQISGMTPLLAARASVGAAESVVLPTLQRLLSKWTTPEQKSLSLALIYSGFQTGTVAAYLLSPFIMDQIDWQGLFYLYGGFGLFWLVPWLMLAKDAPSDMTVPPTKLSIGELDSSTTKPSQGLKEAVESLKSAPWKSFAQSKGAWAMLLAHAANNWGLYILLSWSPTFYVEQYGLNVRDSAVLSVLPSIAGIAGGLAAGSAADSLIKNIDKTDEKAITNIRKLFQGIALYGPSLSLGALAIHIPEEPWAAQLLLTGILGLQAFNAAGYGAANQEKAGERWSGLLYSITSLPAVMVGTFGVYLTGQILDYTHQDWSYVFALNSAVCVLGATAFVTLYDSKREFD